MTNFRNKWFFNNLNVDWLKNNNYDVYFFGLGFIQIKIDISNRIHVYSPDLPAFVESPHDHRYDFVSKVLKGRLINNIWEELEPEVPPHEAFNSMMVLTEVEYTTCKKPEPLEDQIITDGPEFSPLIEPPDSYVTPINYVGEFEIEAGSSYYINRNTFHTVKPDFEAGPCVTHVNRGIIQKDWARVLRFPNDKKLCPFSETVDKSELWDIVDKCLKK